MSRIYKFYASSSGTNNALAQIQILATCRIKSVRWRVASDTITDGAIHYAEISTQAVNQATVNNPAGIISCVRVAGNFVTSGLDISCFAFQDLVDCPLTIGQIVYLNTFLAAGTISSYYDVFLDCTA